MENNITSDDILGKLAVDPSGSILGVVVKLHINKDSQKILGITVDKGFMKPDLFIGVDYIKRFGIDAVLLNKIPKEKLEGLEVFTEAGERIGRVKEVLMPKSEIRGIVIRHEKSRFKIEDIQVPISKIKEIGASVIVKKNYT